MTPLGHSWDEGKITTEPTETAEGLKTYTCSTCGETKAEVLPKLEHVHSYTDTVTAPTCTEKGYATHTCACGYSYTDTEVEALGHTEVIDAAVDAACEDTGLTEGKHCAVCDAVLVKQEVVPAKGHSYENGKCTACGAEDPDWQEPTEPETEPTEPETEPTEPETEPTEPEMEPTEPQQPEEPEERDEILRLAGDTRFDTAFLVADQMKENLGAEKFETVIVASGTNFADALSGSYLAAVKNAPILLSFDETYNEMAKKYIRENLVPGGTVYILGGASAVPESMESGLEAFHVKRLAGDDRFGTNLAILEEAGVEDKDILVCTGLSFADSLSASASKLPILLVWENLTEDQKIFLLGLDGNGLRVIGGTGAVSESMENQLKAYGHTTRIGGSNRFETSVLIAEEFFGEPDSAVLAYAWNYPDGLCGGALAATMDAPLILTMTGYEAAAREYAQNREITKGTVLGGTGLISEASAGAIFGRIIDGENMTPLG